MDETTKRLQLEAERIAAKHRLPEFYVRFKASMALARRLYFTDPIVILLRETVIPLLHEDLGHGIFHSSRVSQDTATLVHVELLLSPVTQVRKERTMVLGLIAGLLHDICRGEEKHAERGAEEARELLKPFPLHLDEVDCVCQAIANHEAFVPSTRCEKHWVQLVSDSLYDADKFRWGRDTFTHTLWHMVQSQSISPRELIDKFPWGMNGIIRVADTFRSSTGRQYGPEIVEAGLEIGREIYRYLLQNY